MALMMAHLRACLRLYQLLGLAVLVDHVHPVALIVERGLWQNELRVHVAQSRPAEALALGTRPIAARCLDEIEKSVARYRAGLLRFSREVVHSSWRLGLSNGANVTLERGAGTIFGGALQFVDESLIAVRVVWRTFLVAV